MPSAALLARATAAPTATQHAAESIVADVLSQTTPVDDGPESRIYRVRAGDTLYAIARRNGVSVNQLKSWNNLRGNTLKIGTRLVIQAPRTANTQ
jgi:LysM repeat protein